ncbi:hypothetical protein Tsubulata_033968, partial [Turnera subulata]
IIILSNVNTVPLVPRDDKQHKILKSILLWNPFLPLLIQLFNPTLKFQVITTTDNLILRIPIQQKQFPGRPH